MQQSVLLIPMRTGSRCFCILLMIMLLMILLVCCSPSSSASVSLPSAGLNSNMNVNCMEVGGGLSMKEHSQPQSRLSQWTHPNSMDNLSGGSSPLEHNLTKHGEETHQFWTYEDPCSGIGQNIRQMHSHFLLQKQSLTCWPFPILSLASYLILI